MFSSTTLNDIVSPTVSLRRSVSARVTFRVVGAPVPPPPQLEKPDLAGSNGRSGGGGGAATRLSCSSGARWGAAAISASSNAKTIIGTPLDQQLPDRGTTSSDATARA